MNGPKTVFISGSNRGIGHELALQMSKQDFKVVAGYRDASRSTQLLEMAQEMTNLFTFKVDATVETDLIELHTFILREFKYLDVLINNAGVNINPSLDIQEINWFDIARSFEVNVGGPFLTTKYLYPLIKAGRKKKIINISSKIGSIKLSGGDATPYRISKAGLNMLTKNQSETIHVRWYRRLVFAPWLGTN